LKLFEQQLRSEYGKELKITYGKSYEYLGMALDVKDTYCEMTMSMACIWIHGAFLTIQIPTANYPDFPEGDCPKSRAQRIIFTMRNESIKRRAFA